MRAPSNGRRRRTRIKEEGGRKTAAGLAVIAELERNTEIVLAQMPHRLLELVLRRRADAHLIGLDRGLDLLQLEVFDVFDDLASRFDGNALLNVDDSPDRSAGGRLAFGHLEVLRRHAAPDQPGL